MVSRRPPGLVHILIAVAVGCSSTAQSTPPSGKQPDTIFTDPGLPVCSSALRKSYQLTGQLAGQTIDVETSQVTNLEPQSFQILVVAGDSVRNDLVLTWTVPLVEDKAIPLTGASVRIPDDQPLGGQSFCITAGDFGSARPADPAVGRTLLFRLTGAREGDCSGTEVRMSLEGCVWRSPSASFPAATADAG